MTTKLDTVPGDAATYADQRTFGVIAGRSHVEISPKYGGDFKAGDIIRLEIPAQAWLDPNEFYIHFRTAIKLGPGNTLTESGTNATDNAGILTGHVPDPTDGATATTENIVPFQSDTSLSASHKLIGPFDNGGADREAWFDSGKTVQFVPGIQSIFNRVRLLAGSVVLEDIQDYNVLYRMLLESTTTKAWRDTDGFTEEGWYDPCDADQKMENSNFHAREPHGPANKGHVYTIRPLLGLFAAGKYIPLKYMGQLTLEFYLESNEECLWSTTSNGTDVVLSSTAADVNAVVNKSSFPTVARDGLLVPTRYEAYDETTCHPPIFSSSDCRTDFPNASYVVRDVRMHVPFVHPIESFDQAMMKQIEAGRIEIYHSSWSTHTRNLASTSNRSNLSFQERALSLKGALACMRNSTDIRQIDSDFTFPANGIAAYQWKIGSEYIPAQEIDCTNGGGRALAQLKQALGIYGDRSETSNIQQHNFLPAVVPPQYDTNDKYELKRGHSEPSNFFLGLDLEKSPDQASGFDSAASSVDVELIITLQTHHKIVGSGVFPAYPFRGADPSTTWQPSKKRVIAPLLDYTVGSVAAANAPFATNAMYIDSAQNMNKVARISPQNKGNSAASGFTRPWFDRPTGAMLCKDLDVVITPAATPPANLSTAGVRVLKDQSGKYARVYFFAHIDQKLRFAAVGRMEIVR